MYTLIISIVCGIVLASGLYFGDVSSILWSPIFGVLFALAVYALLSLWFRRAINKHMKAIQAIMENGQKQIQMKVNIYQTKPMGSPNQVMAELEKMQKTLILQTLEAIKILDPYKRWVPLMARQIATMRMQFCYQLKDFNEVDKLLPQCLMIDPTTMSMKLAQMHRKKEPLEAQRKFFDKSISRVKYNQGVLLYSLMAWIYVQNQNADEAHKILIDATKNTENETIKKNRDRLANNKLREFSNVGLGDLWYALLLETPKIQTRRQQGFSGRPF